jgi:hypothetical protein
MSTVSEYEPLAVCEVRILDRIKPLAKLAAMQ